MQHACTPPAPPDPLAHGDAPTAGMPLKCKAIVNVRRKRTEAMLADLAG
jgi:hypothetical protein